MMRTGGLVLRIMGAACLLLSSVAGAAAEFTTPTLTRIAETGKIKIGYGETAPFSFLNADGEVIGYSIDICRMVAEKLRGQLGLSAIEIEFVPRSPSNRVQLLNDGIIDIECNASTNTEERRKSVSFSYSHFYSATRYVSLAKHQLKGVDDLRGRSVSVALGTVNVGDINELNRARKLNISMVPVSSIQSAFDLVAEGKVAAFAMDEVLLRTMIAKTGEPEKYRLSEDVVKEVQPYGFMMRLNDTAFTSSVNMALQELFRSPDFVEIHSRWFENPVPSLGINLKLPMSTELLNSFQELSGP